MEFKDFKIFFIERMLPNLFAYPCTQIVSSMFTIFNRVDASIISNKSWFDLMMTHYNDSLMREHTHRLTNKLRSIHGTENTITGVLNNEKWKFAIKHHLNCISWYLFGIHCSWINVQSDITSTLRFSDS